MKAEHVKLICEELRDSSMLRETLLKELAKRNHVSGIYS